MRRARCFGKEAGAEETPIGQNRNKQRLKRAVKRKRKALAKVQDERRGAHALEGFGVAAEADVELRFGDVRTALVQARRAASLLPRDVNVALLYVSAAEKAHDLLEERRALEHLAKLVEPDAKLLIRLAYLCLQAGEMPRALEFSARARNRLPRRMQDRKRWLALLDHVERAAARAEPGPNPEAETTAVESSLFPDDERSSTEIEASSTPAFDDSVLNAAGVKYRKSAALGRDPKAAGPNGGTEALSARLAERVPFRIPLEMSAEVRGIDALAAGDFASIEEGELAVLAAGIRDAESYDRLLALERASGLTRFSHQEETARRVLSRFLGRALLADEVGLGKTIEAGLVLSEYLLRGRVESALVLVPPSLVSQWREELGAKFGIAVRTTEEARFRDDAAAFWRAGGVAIASLATARSSRHRELVTGRTWDLVIVDEAHVVKNARTESHALVAALTSRFLLLLTATPIENRLEELYNLVNLIRSGHLGGRSEFLRRYGDRKGGVREAAAREVRGLLGEIMIRNTRALSGVQLPPRFARTVLVEPDPAEGELYALLAGVIRAFPPGGRARLLLSVLLQEAGSSPHAVAATLEKIRASGVHSEDLLARLAPAIDVASGTRRTGKGEAIVRLLADGEPSVVFTRFRATLDFLAAALDSRGLRFERLDGDLAPPLRRDAVERCRDERKTLLSTDVGSEGLNLQFCRRIVNFDLPWNPMRIEQRIGRLHRIGQDHPVDVVNFCLAGSIEERILEILDQRINAFELVIGEVEMILGYLEDEREFEDIVLDAFSASEAGERERRFAKIGDALAAARSRYQGVKAFDEKFFRNELGV